MTHDIMVRRPELYDVTLEKPDDFDNDWMSFSHDSAMMARRKLPQKEVIPVKSPVVKVASSPPLDLSSPIEETSPTDNRGKSRHRDVTTEDTSPTKEKNENRATGIHSIEMLDTILNSHSRYRHSTGTSISIGSARMAESHFSSQHNDSVFFEGNRNDNNNSYMTQQSTRNDIPHTPIITSLNDTMHNEFSTVTMTQQCSNPSESPKEIYRTISQDDLTPSIKQSLIDPTVMQQSKISKSSSSKFLTLPSPRSIQKADSLLIRKMAGSPKMRRSQTDPMSSSFENLMSGKGLCSPYGSTPALSLKATPNATPELYGHGSPTVVPGISVTDVLSQEYSGLKNNSFESKRQYDDSVFSYGTSEMNSFDESSNSFSESQDLVTSEGEGMYLNCL